MIFEYDDWKQRILCGNAKLREYLEKTEKRTGKEIHFLDIEQHSRSGSVNGLLGTVLSQSSSIILYLNRQEFAKIDNAIFQLIQRKSLPGKAYRPTEAERNLLNAFGHTVSHELIHYEMDEEGFPVTRNRPGFENDIVTIRLGTLLQDSVLHGELLRRQLNMDLPLSDQKPPADVLLESLIRLKISVSTEEQERIRVLCHVDENGLDPENAFYRLSELVQLLKLEDRLIVELASV